jgi:NAD(P)-dependent dehydrogenase (short-subunit alcohol dehydrogenase family)
LETSLVFANEGAHVVAADINYEAAQKTVALIEKECKGSVKAIAVKADVSKEEEIKQMVKQAVDEFGRLDVVL